MYFTTTKLARSTVGATLLVALFLSAPAFAVDPGTSTLTSNERAAQNAIAYSPTYGADLRSDSRDAALTYNEAAAQHAIATAQSDSEFAKWRGDAVSGASSEATLVHNELSAQRAIADTQAPSVLSSAHRSNAALSPSTSNQSAAQR